MKKYLLLTLASLFSASLYAQSDIVVRGSTKTTIEATPHQIIDSLKKLFPNAKSVQSYQTPPDGVKNDWQITKDDEIQPHGNLTRYTISFKSDEFQYFALFEPDGTLLRSKYQQNGATLPKAAKASLQKLVGANYKGYTIISKTYYKEVNYKKHTNYYELVAVNKSNPNIKKKITLDEAGNVVKAVDL